MRFHADGPSIPDALLEQRDEGRVVFLCGAGVSEPSGLPNFEELTKEVIARLDPDKDSRIIKAFERSADEGIGSPKDTLDQIFELLYDEFGRGNVDEIVAECLCEGASIESTRKEHSLIARVSSDPSGNPQIVTTNFDRLFEKYLDEPNLYTPSDLSKIEFDAPINGVVYLHGRLRHPCAPLEVGETDHNYTLSSSDFGRAYLSDGKATSFMKELLTKYTVVMIGYQAKDPPVRYLLQGLHQSEGSETNLYAFAPGSREEVDGRWRDLGVTAIAYNHSFNHKNLWDTIEAWAKRSDDQKSWRNGVLGLAERGPRALAPHERGQVVHLVRTKSGARLFARHKPMPTAEWLCVFDVSCRIARKGKSRISSVEEFYPLDGFSIDDDRSHFRTEQQVLSAYSHPLGWCEADKDSPKNPKLEIWKIGSQGDMPERLKHLMGWVARSADSPCVAWWVARKYRIHPRHLTAMRRTLSKKDNLHSEARRMWGLIRKMVRDERYYPLDARWMDFFDMLKKEDDDWGRVTLHAFDNAVRPRLIRNSPYDFDGSMPHMEAWSDPDARKFVNWEIKFQEFYSGSPDIPDGVLAKAFKILEKNLRLAVSLHHDIGTKGDDFDTPRCYPKRTESGVEFQRDHDAFFNLFLGLIDRMREKHPRMLKSHVLNWKESEQFFFRKLKLYALNGKPFDASAIAEIVLGFDQDALWDDKTKQELLFLIADHRSGFAPEMQVAIVDRLLSGNEGEDDPFVVASYVTWLKSEGFPLTDDQKLKLLEITQEISDWSDGVAIKSVMRRGLQAFSKSTDTDPQCLLDIPVSEIFERTEAERRFDSRLNKLYEPFEGLVKVNPYRALTALFHAAKRGNYPVRCWGIMISNWTRNLAPRCVHISLLGATRFPIKTIQALNYTIGSWIMKEFRFWYASDRELAWSFCDAAITGLLTNDVADSDISRTAMLGENPKPLRRLGLLIDSPIEMITKGWLDALHLLDLPPNQGMPGDFKERLERLASTPGESRNSVAVTVSREISWLYDLDPDWILKYVIPWFEFEHIASEFAWEGLLTAEGLPPQKIREAIKSWVANLFPCINKWHLNKKTVTAAVKLIVEFSILEEDDPSKFTEEETRYCIRKMGNKNTPIAISCLSEIGASREGGWNRLVPEFIERVWPRDKDLRNPQMVLAWLEMLIDAGDDFPRILRCVRRFLVPTDGTDYRLRRVVEKDVDKDSLAERYPEAVLDLLYAVVQDQEPAPSELGEILMVIRTANRSLAGKEKWKHLSSLT